MWLQCCFSTTYFLYVDNGSDCVTTPPAVPMKTSISGWVPLQWPFESTERRPRAESLSGNNWTQWVPHCLQRQLKLTPHLSHYILSSFLSLQDGGEESESVPLGHLAPPWLPDSAVSMCQLCSVQFTVTRRRHHCRACGQVSKTILVLLVPNLLRFLSRFSVKTVPATWLPCAIKVTSWVVCVSRAMRVSVVSYTWIFDTMKRVPRCRNVHSLSNMWGELACHKDL